MHRRQVLALSGALTAGALGGCLHRAADGGTPPAADPGATPAVEDDALQQLVLGTNGFTVDLYRRLVEAEPDANCVASPLSVSLALGMTYAGARGETREQMRETLRYRLDDPALHDAYATLQHRLDERDADVDTGGTRFEKGDDPVPFELSIVNALWGQSGFPFASAFLDTVDAHYGGGFRAVDFNSDPTAARESINDWVAEQTNDRIGELLPPDAVTTMTRLVLTNAVYFQANWQYQFDEGSTETGTFAALDGESHEVPLMRAQREWSYAEVDGARAVDLPYLGEDVSMLVVLPPDGEFEAYERDFDGTTLSKLVEALEPREGTVRLPRFEFESGFRLGDALRTLGMTDAFDPQVADFSGMVAEDASRRLAVDEVYHDTSLTVDETGTEAAAATGVVMVETSAPLEPFEFVADRPFFFAIRDRPTETVLFLGRVVDPAGWE
jgi:serpin B